MTPVPHYLIVVVYLLMLLAKRCQPLPRRGGTPFLFYAKEQSQQNEKEAKEYGFASSTKFQLIEVLLTSEMKMAHAHHVLPASWKHYCWKPFDHVAVAPNEPWP